MSGLARGAPGDHGPHSSVLYVGLSLILHQRWPQISLVAITQHQFSIFQIEFIRLRTKTRRDCMPRASEMWFWSDNDGNEGHWVGVLGEIEFGFNYLMCFG